jgi:hypothetical protein
MEVATDETRLTYMTFINADGIAQPTSTLRQQIITDKGLDTVASTAEMLEWQSTIIGIGDAQNRVKRVIWPSKTERQHLEPISIAEPPRL